MATSGGAYTGYQNYTRFYLTWSLADQDIAGNRSLISWEIGIQGTSGYTAYWYSNAVKINSGYVNGSQVAGASTYSNITLSGAERHRLRSGSIWVGHNSDGAKSFSVSVSGWLYNLDSRSASDSWALPTIPRGADPSTNKSSYTIGEAITIHTNRKSSSFSHTVRLENEGGGDAIRSDFNNVGSSVQWTPSQADINEIQSRIPNSNTFRLQIAVYNNQVKEWRRIVRTLTLTNANPQFANFAYKDNNAATVAITGSDQILVNGKSTLQVTVPSADKMVAIKASTANRYSIAYDGSSKQVNYATTNISASFTNIATIGNRTIQVTAYDSRSNTTKVAKNVTVYDYAAPTITTTLERENNFGSNTTLHIEGTYTPLVIGGANKNVLTTGSLGYRYKSSDTTTWGAWTTRAFTANTTDGTFSITDFVISLNNQNKYDFEFHISDKFGQATATNSVDVGVPIMFVGQNSGVGSIGINKMPENGALDVGGDIYSNGKKVMTNINYSTTEQDTGLKWVDGAAIYQKTITSTTNTTTATKTIPHGISNLGVVVNIEGTIDAADSNQYRIIGANFSPADSNYTYYRIDPTNIYTNSNGAPNLNTTFYLTIRYTKV